MGYNYVVIDSQPITCAVDASILANAADAVVLVVEAGRNLRRTVHSAISTISGAARKPPFIVLNKV